MSGLRIVTENNDFNTFKVSNVLPNTPGAEVGLQKGDIILKINDQPTDKMKLNQIWKILSPEKEKTLDIVIKRNDTKMIKKLKLRRII
jgi:C-terminal processing protease CtpA/Prc